MRSSIAAKGAEEMLTATEAAALLMLSAPTFYRRVRAGTVPTPVHLGPRMVRWRRSDIERAAEGRR